MNKKTVASVKYPTPQWLRIIVRCCLWITGLYAFVSIQIDFTDFGVSIATENLILKYMAVFSSVISVVARFIGEKPINFATQDFDMEKQAWLITDQTTVEGVPVDTFIINSSGEYYRGVNSELQPFLATTQPSAQLGLNINGAVVLSTSFVNGVPPIFP